MQTTITAHFDGKVLVPDQPLNLSPGQSVRIQIEWTRDTKPRFADLLEFASDLPDAPSDLAANHDRYLYGREDQ